MDFFQWEDRYSLDIELIDGQHKYLIKIINDLHRSLINGTTNKIIEDTLSSLIDYTNYHFNSEEEILISCNYPSYESHKNQHDTLTRQVLEIQKNIHNKSGTLSYEIMDFLADWLINHILNEDQKYGIYLKTQDLNLHNLAKH